MADPARYYDPAVAQFLTVDPAEGGPFVLLLLDAGIAYAIPQGAPRTASLSLGEVSGAPRSVGLNAAHRVAIADLLACEDGG